jgi:hypothetical protein
MIIILIKTNYILTKIFLFIKYIFMTITLTEDKL